MVGARGAGPAEPTSSLGIESKHDPFRIGAGISFTPGEVGRPVVGFFVVSAFGMVGAVAFLRNVYAPLAGADEANVSTLTGSTARSTERVVRSATVAAQSIGGAPCLAWRVPNRQGRR
jgi:hypothetical protein